MRVLFLGGTGNISADCAALVHERGHEVGVATRGNRTVPGDYREVIVDRRDGAALHQAVHEFKPEVIVDFLGYEVSDVQLAFDACRGVVAQYLFISSATVYVKPPPRLPITEDFPLGNAWWDYAQKKIACEDWLREAAAREAFPTTIVRPSHTYSKRWAPNPVSSSSYTFAARLAAGKPVFVPDAGETPWTLTASSDFAVGLAGLIGSRNAIGEAFHITSDEVLTWNQICREIATAVGASAPDIVPVPTDFICEIAPRLTGNLKGDKAYPGVFDNRKIKRFVPEFRCVKPFRVGVRQSVEWLRGHPEDQNLNPQVDALCDEVIGAWRNHSARESPSELPRPGGTDS